jgi:hypothetical protein
MRNRTGRELRATRLQTKLVVGPAHDHFEREADSVARQVMARIESRPQAGGSADPVNRATVDEDELLQGKRISRASVDEEELLQGKRTAVVQRITGSAVGPEGGALDSETAGRITSARSGGAAMEPMLRRSMERAFGADFSSVRLHVGGGADRLNADLGARAFTSGSDVFVRSQDYQPGTRGGRELLAHELTHVVQQGGAPSLDHH